MANKSNRDNPELNKHIKSDMRASKDILKIVELASKAHERELNNPFYIALQETLANQKITIEYNKYKAKVTKAYVDALMDEGFNEDRAIQIAIAHC